MPSCASILEVCHARSTQNGKAVSYEQFERGKDPKLLDLSEGVSKRLGRRADLPPVQGNIGVAERHSVIRSVCQTQGFASQGTRELPLVAARQVS
jgi:hypothetical protein